jgi:hypothetical protein
MIYLFVSSDFCLVMMTGVQNLQIVRYNRLIIMNEFIELLHSIPCLWLYPIHTQIVLAASIWPI